MNVYKTVLHLRSDVYEQVTLKLSRIKLDVKLLAMTKTRLPYVKSQCQNFTRQKPSLIYLPSPPKGPDLALNRPRIATSSNYLLPFLSHFRKLQTTPLQNTMIILKQ